MKYHVIILSSKGSACLNKADVVVGDFTSQELAIAGAMLINRKLGEYPARCVSDAEWQRLIETQARGEAKVLNPKEAKDGHVFLIDNREPVKWVPMPLTIGEAQKLWQDKGEDGPPVLRRYAR